MNTRHLPYPYNVGQQHVRSAGVTLIEAVMSMLIVGLMLVAALNTVGASRVTQSRSTEQTIGPMLADELMAEILNQNYEEPDDPVQVGRELNEAASSRQNWDDVDDYGGWSSSPPKKKDGTVIPGLDGWQRSVSICFVQSSALNYKSAVDTGIKRIDISVKYNGRLVTRLSSLRTNGWPGDLAGGASGDAVANPLVLE